nr:MARTX multifunctional-autoprocessing repeats-in-toxin holotoxin RtxA [Vibrio salilacus]
MGKPFWRSVEYFFTGNYSADDGNNNIVAIGFGGEIHAYGGDDHVTVGSIGATVYTGSGNDTVVGGSAYLRVNDTTGHLTVKGAAGYADINKSGDGNVSFSGAAGGVSIDHLGNHGDVSYGGVAAYNGITRKGLSGNVTFKGAGGYNALWHETNQGNLSFAGAGAGNKLDRTWFNRYQGSRGDVTFDGAGAANSISSRVETGSITFRGAGADNHLVRKGKVGDITLQGAGASNRIERTHQAEDAYTQTRGNIRFEGVGGYNSLYSDVAHGDIHFSGGGAHNTIIRKGSGDDFAKEGMANAKADKVVLTKAVMSGSWIGQNHQVTAVKSANEPNTYLFAFADSTYTKINKVQLRNDPQTGELRYYSTAWYIEGNHLNNLANQDISSNGGFTAVNINGAYTLSDLKVEHQQSVTVHAVEKSLTEYEWVTYANGAVIDAKDVSLSDAKMGGHAIDADGTKVDVKAVKSNRKPNTYVYAKVLGPYTKIVVVELANDAETGTLKYQARSWYKEGDHTANLANEDISSANGYHSMGKGGYSLSTLNYSVNAVRSMSETVADIDEYTDQTLFKPASDSGESSGDVHFNGVGGGNVIKSNVTRGHVHFNGGGLANVILHSSQFGNTEFNGAGAANVIVKSGEEGDLTFRGAGLANVLVHQSQQGKMDVYAGGALNVLVRVGNGDYLAHLLAYGNISVQKGQGNSRVTLLGGYNTHTQIGSGDALWLAAGGFNVMTQVGKGDVASVLVGGANVLTKVGDGDLAAGMLGGANVITHISGDNETSNTTAVALGGANILTKKGKGNALAVMGGGANVLTHVGDGTTTGVMVGGANILTKVGNGDTTGIMLGVGNVLTHVGDGQTLGVMGAVGNIFTKVGDGTSIAAMIGAGNIFTHVGEGNAWALMGGLGNVFTKVGNGDALALMVAKANVFTHIGDGMSVALMLAQGNVATKVGNGTTLAAMVGNANIFTHVGSGSTFAAMIGQANIMTKVGNDLTAALVVGKANIMTHVGDGTSLGIFAGEVNVMTKVGNGTTLAAMFGKANIMTHVGDGLTGVLALGEANIVTKVGDDFMGVVAAAKANVVTHVGDATTAAVLAGKGNILTKVGEGTTVGLLISDIGNVMTHVGDGTTIGIAKGKANIVTKVGDGLGVNVAWGQANVFTQVGDGDRYNFAKGEANIITKVGDGQEVSVVQGKANIITHVGNGDDYTGTWGKANVITKVGNGRNVVLAKGEANIVTQVGDGDSFNALWSKGNIVTKVGDGMQVTAAKGKANVTTRVGDGLNVTAAYGDANINTVVGDGISVNVAWGKYNVNTKIGDGLNVAVMKGKANANIHIGDGLGINASYAQNNVAIKIGNGDFYTLAVASSNTSSNKLSALFDNIKQTVLGVGGSQAINYLVQGDEASSSGTHKGRGAIATPEITKLDGFQMEAIEEVGSDLGDSLTGSVTKVDAPDLNQMQNALSVDDSSDQVQGPNLIVNGDFEQSDFGWSSTHGVEADLSASSYGLERDGHGNNVSELATDQSTTIYQDIQNLTEGEVIAVSFDFAKRAGISNNEGIDVLWNGEVVFSSSGDESAWQQKTLKLTTHAGSNRIEFKGTGHNDGLGYILDNVVAKSESSQQANAVSEHATQNQASQNALSDKDRAEADRQRLEQEKQKQLDAVAGSQSQLESTDQQALENNGQAQRDAVTEESEAVTAELTELAQGLDVLDDKATHTGESGDQWRNNFAGGLLDGVQTQLDNAKQVSGEQIAAAKQTHADNQNKVKDAVAQSEAGVAKGEQNQAGAEQDIADAQADAEKRKANALAKGKDAQQAESDAHSAASEAQSRADRDAMNAENKANQAQNDAKGAKQNEDDRPDREGVAGSGLSGNVHRVEGAGEAGGHVNTDSPTNADGRFSQGLTEQEQEALEGATNAVNRLQINAGIRGKNSGSTITPMFTETNADSIVVPTTASQDVVRKEIRISGVNLEELSGGPGSQTTGPHSSKSVPGFQSHFASTSIGIENELSGLVVVLPKNSAQTFGYVHDPQGNPLFMLTKDMNQGGYSNPAGITDINGLNNWQTHTIELVTYPSETSDTTAIESRKEAMLWLAKEFTGHINQSNHQSLPQLVSDDGRFTLVISNSKHFIAAGNGTSIEAQGQTIGMTPSGQQATMAISAKEFGSSSSLEVRLLESAPWYQSGLRDEFLANSNEHKLDDPEAAQNVYAYLTSVYSKTADLAKEFGIYINDWDPASEGFSPNAQGLTDPKVKNAWEILPRTKPVKMLDLLSADDSRYVRQQIIEKLKGAHSESLAKNVFEYFQYGGEVAGHGINNATTGNAQQPEPAILFEFRSVPSVLSEFVPKTESTAKVDVKALDHFDSASRKAIIVEVNALVSGSDGFDAWYQEYRASKGQPPVKNPKSSASANHKAEWLMTQYADKWAKITAPYIESNVNDHDEITTLMKNKPALGDAETISNADSRHKSYQSRDLVLEPIVQPETIELGMPDIDQKILAEVAERENVIIGVRPVDEKSKSLIDSKLYSSKGLFVKAKSSDWGPMSGFIPVDQSFAKASARRDLDKFNGYAEQSIESGNAISADLYLNQVRMDELVSKYQSLAALEFDAESGMYKTTATNDDQTVTFFLNKVTVESKDLWQVHYMKDGELAPFKVIGDPVSKQPMTADYDLLTVMYSYADLGPQDKIKQPLTWEQWKESVTYEDLTPKYQELYSSEELYNKKDGASLGVVSDRLKTLKDVINTSLGRTDGLEMVHHGADDANPYAVMADNFPATFFVPKSFFMEDGLGEGKGSIQTYFNVNEQGAVVIRDPQEFSNFQQVAINVSYRASLNDKWNDGLDDPLFTPERKLSHDFLNAREEVIKKLIGEKTNAMTTQSEATENMVAQQLDFSEVFTREELAKSANVFGKKIGSSYQAILGQVDLVHKAVDRDLVLESFKLNNKIIAYLAEHPTSGRNQALAQLKEQVTSALFVGKMQAAQVGIDAIAQTRPELATRIYMVAIEEANGKHAGLTDMMVRWANEDPYLAPKQGYKGETPSDLAFDAKYHVDLGDHYTDFKQWLETSQSNGLLSKALLDEATQTVHLGYSYQELQDLTGVESVQMAFYFLKEAAKKADPVSGDSAEMILLKKFADQSYLTQLNLDRMDQIEGIYRSSHETDVDAWDSRYSGVGYDELSNKLAEKNSIEEQLSVLLDERKGLLIGEVHGSDVNGLRFVNEQMDALKKQGISVIGLEHLRSDLAQSLIDSYLATGVMSSELSAMLKTKHLDVTLFENARANGMRVVALDANSSARPNVQGTEHGLMYRAGAANNIAVEILQNLPDGEKFVAIYGKAHLQSHKGIEGFVPGITHRLDLPALKVSDSNQFTIEQDDVSLRVVYDDVANKPKITFKDSLNGKDGLQALGPKRRPGLTLNIDLSSVLTKDELKNEAKVFAKPIGESYQKILEQLDLVHATRGDKQIEAALILNNLVDDYVSHHEKSGRNSALLSLKNRVSESLYNNVAQETRVEIAKLSTTRIDLAADLLHRLHSSTNKESSVVDIKYLADGTKYSSQESFAVLSKQEVPFNKELQDQQLVQGRETGEAVVNNVQLSDDEIKGIKWYTSEGFQYVNEALRKEEKLTYFVKDNAVNAVKGLNKLETFEGTVYRAFMPGVSLSDLASQVTPGQLFSDQGFTSTSTSTELAKSFRGGKDTVILTILDAKGTNVAGLAQLNQAEVLLKPGAHLRIEAVKETDQNLHIVAKYTEAFHAGETIRNLFDGKTIGMAINPNTSTINESVITSFDHDDITAILKTKPLLDSTHLENTLGADNHVQNHNVQDWHTAEVAVVDGGDTRFDGQVIVQMENDPVVAKAAANLAGKHAESSVVVQLDSDGNYRVVYGEPSKLDGKLRWQLVGHGRDNSESNNTRLSGYSADELAVKLANFQQTFNQAENISSKPDHISVVGCSLVSDDKQKGFGHQFINAMDVNGLRVDVSVRSAKVYIDEMGRKLSFDGKDTWINKAVNSKVSLSWNDQGEVVVKDEHIRNGVAEGDIHLSRVGASEVNEPARGAIGDNSEVFEAPEKRKTETDTTASAGSDNKLSYSGNIQVNVGDGEFTAVNWGTSNVGIKVGTGGFKSLAFGDNNVMVHIGNGDSKHSVDIAGYQALEGAQMFMGNRNVSFNMGRSNDLIVMMDKSIPTPPLVNPFDGASRISGVLQNIAQSGKGADWLAAQEQQWTLSGAKKFVKEMSGLDQTSSVDYSSLVDLDSQNERSSRGLKSDAEATLNKKYNQWLSGNSNHDTDKMSRADKFRQMNEKLAFNFAVGGQGADIQVTTGNWNFMFGDNIQAILDTNLGSLFGVLTQQFSATGMAQTTFTYNPQDLPRQLKNKLLGKFAEVGAETTLGDIFGVNYTADGKIVSRTDEAVDGVTILKEMLEVIGEFGGEQLSAFTEPEKLLDSLKAGIDMGADGLQSFAESHGLKEKAPEENDTAQVTFNGAPAATKNVSATVEETKPERAFGFNALNLPNLFATMFSKDKQAEMASLVSNLKQNLTADLLNMKDKTFDFLRNSGHLQGDGDMNVSLGNYNFNWGGDGKDLGAYLGDNNNFWGGRGDDVFYATGVSNIFTGGEGHDMGVLMGRENMMFGGDGNDTAVVAGRINHVFMGAGDDQSFVFGEGGEITMESGNDYAVTSGNFNRVDMGDDQDFAVTIGNNNQLDLGAGNDFARVFGNHNRIDAGQGNDEVKLMGYHASINAGEGEDYLTAAAISKFSTLNGGEGNDVMVLGGYQNTFKGDAGVDSFVVSGEVIDNLVEDIRSEDNIVFNGIDWQKLWFERSGYDLTLSILRDPASDSDQAKFEHIGSVTFNDYFDGNRAQVVIAMGDKDAVSERDYTALSDNSIDALVQAMSSFAPQAGDNGFIDSLDSKSRVVVTTAWADVVHQKGLIA